MRKDCQGKSPNMATDHSLVTKKGCIFHWRVLLATTYWEVGQLTLRGPDKIQLRHVSFCHPPHLRFSVCSDPFSFQRSCESPISWRVFSLIPFPLNYFSNAHYQSSEADLLVIISAPCAASPNNS